MNFQEWLTEIISPLGLIIYSVLREILIVVALIMFITSCSNTKEGLEKDKEILREKIEQIKQEIRNG